MQLVSDADANDDDNSRISVTNNHETFNLAGTCSVDGGWKCAELMADIGVDSMGATGAITSTDKKPMGRRPYTDI